MIFEWMNRFIRSLIKKVWLWVIIIELLVGLILYSLGFRIVVANVVIDWNATAAVAQWVSALIGVFVPIAIVYIQHRLNMDKKEIGESNTALYTSLNNKINELEKKIVEVDGGSASKQDNEAILYNKIYEFICIRMAATTKEIAEEFNIDIEKARELLIKMNRVDEMIKPASISFGINDDEFRWKKA